MPMIWGAFLITKPSDAVFGANGGVVARVTHHTVSQYNNGKNLFGPVHRVRSDLNRSIGSGYAATASSGHG